MLQKVISAAERKVAAVQELVKFMEGISEIHKVMCSSMEKLVSKSPQSLNQSDESTVASLWGAVLKWADARVRSAADTTQETRRLRDALESLSTSTEGSRKKLAAEGQRLERRLADTVHQLHKAKERYDKAVKESEQADAAVEAEKKKSKPAVEQAEKKALRLRTEASVAEGAYRAQIKATNAVTAEFYGTQVPALVAEFTAVFALRVTKVKECFSAFVAAMWTAQEMISPQLRVLEMAVDRVSEEAEKDEFARRYRTALQVPKPFEFEPAGGSSCPPTDPSSVVAAAAAVLSTGPSPRKKLPTVQRSGSQSTISPKEPNSPPPGSDVPPPDIPPPPDIGPPDIGPPVGPPSGNASPSPPGRTKKMTSSKPKVVFGVSLPELMARQKASGRFGTDMHIPYIVKFFVEGILSKNPENVPGVFRVAGSKADMEEIKESIEDGAYKLPADIHDCTSLLKAWFRALPEPIVPANLYDVAVNSDGNQGIVLSIFEQLPEPNKSILVSFPSLSPFSPLPLSPSDDNNQQKGYVVHLIAYLARDDIASKTMMDKINLASVFAPCFLFCPYDDLKVTLVAAEKEKTFLIALIDNSAKLPDCGFTATPTFDIPPPPASTDTGPRLPFSGPRASSSFDTLPFGEGQVAKRNRDGRARAASGSPIPSPQLSEPGPPVAPPSMAAGERRSKRLSLPPGAPDVPPPPVDASAEIGPPKLPPPEICVPPSSSSSSAVAADVKPPPVSPVEVGPPPVKPAVNVGPPPAVDVGPPSKPPPADVGQPPVKPTVDVGPPQSKPMLLALVRDPALDAVISPPPGSPRGRQLPPPTHKAPPAPQKPAPLPPKPVATAIEIEMKAPTILDPEPLAPAAASQAATLPPDVSPSLAAVTEVTLPTLVVDVGPPSSEEPGSEPLFVVFDVPLRPLPEPPKK